MTHEEIKNAVSAYCLGALDNEEHHLVEQHLSQGCTDCETLWREMQGVVAVLPLVAEPASPPASVKQKLMAGIVPEAKTAPGPVSVPKAIRAEDIPSHIIDAIKRRWVRLSWGFALAAIIIGSVFSLYTRSLVNEIAVLENNIRISGAVIGDLQTKLADKERLLQVIEAPQVRLVQLNGAEPAPESSGRVYFDPGTQDAIFIAHNLSQPPSDKDYQLWMIKGAEKIDAGVFTTDADGKVILQLKTISDPESIAAFAVTLEPKGGVPQPTGQIHLLGTTEG